MSAHAKFLTGSTMRHVVVMTLTGSLGLSFMFLVDFLALYWVSRLGNESFIAAIGFAATVQFMLVSISIGMMIAAVALVSRSLGQGDRDRARRIASSALIYATGTQAFVALLVFIYCRPLLALSGAEGEVLQVAVSFLRLSVISLPLVAIGMSAAATLRAAGEAWRSMMVTTTGGLVAIVVDPLLIILLGLGVPGAALAIIISRSVMALAGLYWAMGRGLLARPTWRNLRRTLGPFTAIALPAVATQLSTPFGNWVLIRAMSEHGAAAVAGLGVAARLQILGFGGIFALSGAIGGIIGQNHGAGFGDRVRQSYLDALKFCAVYTAIVWLLMVVFADALARAFGLGGDAADVVIWFAHIGAGSFVFTGALFVANASFNNLGRPIWATGANWFRDGVLMAPFAFGMGALWGPVGVITAQAAANILAGGGAALIGWRHVNHGLDQAAPAS